MGDDSYFDTSELEDEGIYIDSRAPGAIGWLMLMNSKPVKSRGKRPASRKPKPTNVKRTIKSGVIVEFPSLKNRAKAEKAFGECGPL